MKKLFFTLLTLCLCGATYAYDFSADNTEGTTIYYNILETTDDSKQVEVTYTTEEEPDGVNTFCEYSGEITIPSTVSYKAEDDDEETTYSVVGVGNHAFFSCSITKLTIPESVEYLNSYACWNTSSLTDVTISGPVAIGYGAFGMSHVSNVTMDGDVPSIGNYAFFMCSNLEIITIPATVKSYGLDAFKDCSNLKTVILLDDDPSDVVFLASTSGDDDAFGGDTGMTFYVPIGSAALYLASAWAEEANVGDDDFNFVSLNVAAAGVDSEGTSYYSTYYTDGIGEFGSDVTPYIVTAAQESGEITTQALNGYIPNKTGLLLETSKNGTTYYYHPYGVDEDSEGIASTTGNMLYGSKNGGTTTEPDKEGYLYYKLSRNAAGDTGSVGFYWGADGGGAFTSAAGKAYLSVPKDDVDGISYLSLKKGDSDDTTGISAIESASEKAVSGIYTIQGVRVSNMNQPGLYIVDGKKVLVK